jgi:hypothetical protein
MNRDDEREVMKQREAESEVGEHFRFMEEPMKPVVVCPHKVWVRSGFYEPVALEAIACLTRIYGEEPEGCDECVDEELREKEEQEDDDEDEDDEELVAKKKGKKKSKKKTSRDGY